MKENELIKGEYYCINWNLGNNYIFKFRDYDVNINGFEYIETQYKSLRNEFKFDGNCFRDKNRSTCRLATNQEKDQLLQSIKANKFVPLSEIKMNECYEIY